MQQRTERRLAAILTADVVGYSRLMGKDEEGTHAAFKAIRRELTDPKIHEHRGRIVKTTGDGLLVEFASVVDAVRCAVAVQSEMAQRNATVPPEQRIEFRIGINLGDIIIDENDIFGDVVNVAARLEPLAENGGICVSQVVLDQVRDKLGFAFEDMGNQQVKNIVRPIRVYRIPVAKISPTLAVAHTLPSSRPIAYDFYTCLRRLFNFRVLAIIICVAVSASVVPTSMAPFLQLWERSYREPALQTDGTDKLSLSEARATPPTESLSPVAPETPRSSAKGKSIFFEKGKVVLSEAARLTIDRQAALLRDNPKISVTIEDIVPKTKVHGKVLRYWHNSAPTRSVMRSESVVWPTIEFRSSTMPKQSPRWSATARRAKRKIDGPSYCGTKFL